MFTGLIEGIGRIKSVKRRQTSASYEFEVAFDLGRVNVGDSVAVNGCCLTVTSRLGNRFWADISDETLRITALGGLQAGDELNIERALKVGDRLGGHMVQGHIDGVGKITSINDLQDGKALEIQIPKRLMKYVVEKGSLAINGISLTVNQVKEDIVLIRIIPHTVEMTTLKNSRTGDAINLEVDIVGKYVEKLRFLEADEFHKKSKITEEFLKKHGF